jgi:hypothetical protein
MCWSASLPTEEVAVATLGTAPTPKKGADLNISAPKPRQGAALSVSPPKGSPAATPTKKPQGEPLRATKAATSAAIGHGDIVRRLAAERYKPTPPKKQTATPTKKPQGEPLRATSSVKPDTGEKPSARQEALYAKPPTRPRSSS